MLFKLMKYNHNIFLQSFKRLQKAACFKSVYHPQRMNTPNPKVAYFHCSEGADTFKVSFWFISEAPNVNRQFNFERRLVETVDSFLSRVSTNVQKVVGKKLSKLKKKEGNEEPEKKVVVELIANDVEVSKDVNCEDIFFSSKYPFGVLALRIMGINYSVAINFPWIDSMILPSSTMAGFPVYPVSFESKFTDKSLSSFVWKKSVKKNTNSTVNVSKNNENDQWITVGEGFMYLPANSDIGHKLKLECTPKNSTTAGPCLERETSSAVEAGPGHCPFENRHLFTSKKTPHGSFRVVSYNLLADTYTSMDTTQAEYFPYCPAYALNIDYRKQLFMKELLGYNADLICLQEVDTRVFESDLTPVLGLQGLAGVFARKATVSEGVSCFYSTSKFKMLESQEVILSEELLNKNYCSKILSYVNKNAQLKERIAGLGSTAQVVILESIERPGELMVVGNTHLYFHPDSDHIRLLQGGILLAFLEDKVTYARTKLHGKQVSLVCCGDFNSVPSCGIYKLMTTKSVPPDFIDWKSKPEEEVQGLSLSQPFNMQSACGTPKYTNFTAAFADCLDYIYYQTDRLSVESVIPLPSDEELTQHTAIPSVVFPSDHVALVADLRWKV
ncbi:2',5'-phosphodiesterase 12-like [Macrosteles quadrilineatus]|uniref:2',5'-phosphodiesterase 12-like n=1 Tax=Macrosteles quadrilineatus TaxID=74068 RepID=UPI0023E2766F|nr:2',5'-phosphodiesterase 12-like [Macrosteles quadrilineatus]